MNFVNSCIGKIGISIMSKKALLSEIASYMDAQKRWMESVQAVLSILRDDMEVSNYFKSNEQ